jgi:hypothetical protein
MKDTLETSVLVCAPLILLLLVVGSAFEVRQSAQAARDHSAFKAKLPEISTALVALPMEDPPPDSAEYYAIANPVGGTDREKLEQLKVLRAENQRVLASWFANIEDEYGLVVVGAAEEVAHGRLFVKSNCKTDSSTLAKAHRRSILAKSPGYGLEHVRDHFRFKCVVNNVIDAFLFLHALVENDSWAVIKFDIAKFVVSG